jgi:hypothetical protein
VEGALLWQAMLINLDNGDPDLMKVVLPGIISEIMKKIATPTQSGINTFPLRKVLYGVLMAGMI